MKILIAMDEIIHNTKNNEEDELKKAMKVYILNDKTIVIISCFRNNIPDILTYFWYDEIKEYAIDEHLRIEEATNYINN